MLDKSILPPLSDFDRRIYEYLVPGDDILRKALGVIPWDDFYDVLSEYYSAEVGRPADCPVMMLKLEYLRYHFNLSDREVISHARTDAAFRYFLGLPVFWQVPDPTSLVKFRGRLTETGFRQVFDQVVAVAREHGVVKDRMRIKDATHVIGNIAIPTTLALVAQAREKLLVAAAPFAPLLVEGERVNLRMLREATQSLAADQRLATRVANLRDILLWADSLALPENSDSDRAWEKFLFQRNLAHKIVDDQDHPKNGNRTISVTDPDARCGKHGDWFDGYLVDVMMDADSEIITQVNVLSATGDEATDAVELITREEAAHGNDVQAMSMDGVGFNGPVLRELEAPDGLNIDTYVPVPKERENGLFAPKDFKEDNERRVVTCPAGNTSKVVYYDSQEKGLMYQFDAETCAACPLLGHCMENPPKRYGRKVRKSEYQAEHERARKKAATPEFASVRREHLKIERKLGEVMNRHGGRRAQYRGGSNVFIQELMACMATNVKRLVRLLCAPHAQISCDAQA